MKPLLAVTIYLTVMCVAGVSAGYVGLVWLERGMSSPESEVASGPDLDPGKKAHFARQASVFTWGMAAGILFFVVAHIIGFCGFKGGLANLRMDADPDDLLMGLWVHLGAAVLAALFGGAVGVTFG